MKWVYIRWEDSQAQHGWTCVNGEFDTWVEKPNMVVESIGFLVAESKDAYVISGHLDSQASKDHFDGVHSPMKIPKRAVLDIQEIEPLDSPATTKPLDTPEALAFVKKSAEQRTRMGYTIDDKYLCKKCRMSDCITYKDGSTSCERADQKHSGGPYNALFHPESPDEHSGTDQNQNPNVSPME